MLPHSEARPGMVRVAAQPDTESEDVPGAPVFVPAPRDYAGELRANVGEIAGCVSAADIAALPERVEVDLEAVVTGSGIVSRGDVRSAALPQSALRCLRARLDAARFTSPVPDAPRRITARVVLDRRPTPAQPR